MADKNYSHQLDAKNRMRIPAKLREELGEGFYLTVGTGGCLYAYSKEEAEKVKATLKNINPYREKQLKAARFVLFNLREIEEDSQGRFVLPEHLRNYAGIEKNLVIFKGPTCVEIWAEEKWNEYFKDVNFEDIADAIDELNGVNG